ncbi:universal stress protein [Micromonosporaceae bacterium Da 78-11]
MNDQTKRIVVGVDGSEGSKVALKWAMTEAELNGAPIEAITTWQSPVMAGYSYGWSPAPFEGESFAAVMGKILDDTIAEVSAEMKPPHAVVARVAEGNAAQVLLDAARDAQMLVVGSRGHSTFAGILLGSVSQHCVQHASCPVVVVPQ